MANSRTERTAFGVRILNSAHPEIRRLKRAGHVAEIHGNKCWNSSFLIMNHLKRHPPARGCRVLDLGCGWGLLGIYCARQFDAEVTAIDADAKVFPFLELHARLNDVVVHTRRARFEQLDGKFLGRFDLILGADICFWNELCPVLFNLSRRAIRSGAGTIMIADPCRSPFQDLARRCLDHFESVEVLSRRMTRPVRSSGEILRISQPGAN